MDGRLTVGDVVLLMRFVTELDLPNEDEFKRGNVAPATLGSGTPTPATPTLADPREIAVGDVVLLLRAAVDLVIFTRPD